MISFRTSVIRVALVISVATPLYTVAYSASFDCGAARSPVEHAICDDADLSALDSELADAYRAAMKGQGDSAVQLITARLRASDA